MQAVLIQKNHAGQRLDKFIHKFLPAAPTSFIYKMLRKKNIILNGKKADGKEILNIEDEVKFFLSDETILNFSQEKNTNEIADDYINAFQTLKNINIIYEDVDIILLNKPVGILSQKSVEKDLSLNEWLIGYMLFTKEIDKNSLTLFKPSICNRLDRNTSGLVLCGKSLIGSQMLSALIRERNIHKFYRTICNNAIKEEKLIQGNLKKNNKTNTVEITQGNEIKTKYKPIRVLKNNATYLEVELITGKTHQIRAHLASIHHGIIGDTKYGNDKANLFYQNRFKLKHQLLHAYRIEFPQMSKEFQHLSNKKFIAPLPIMFSDILEDLS